MAVKDQVLRMKYENSEANRAIAESNKAFAEQGKALDEVSKKLDQQSNKFTETYSATQLARTGVEFLTGAFQSLLGLVERGQAFSELSGAFEALYGQSQALGKDGLGTLREALQGTVSDLDILKSANQAAQAGLSADDFLVVAQAAETLGDKIGKGPNETLEQLSRALATGQERQLKFLVGTIDNVKVQDEFAKKLGTTGDQLSETGKLAAIQEEVIRRLKQEIEGATEAQRTAGDELERLKASYDNQITALGDTINNNEALRDTFVGIREAIEQVDPTAVVIAINAIANAAKAGIETLNDFVFGLASINNPTGLVAGNTFQEQSQVIKNALNLDLELETLEQLHASLEEAQARVTQLSVQFGENSEEATLAQGQVIGYERAIQKLRDSVDEAGPALTRNKEDLVKTGDEAKKAAEKVAKLQFEFAQLGTKTEITGLQQQIEKAIEGVDRSSFDSIRTQIEEQFRGLKTAELSEKFGKAVNETQIAERVSAEWDIAAKDYEEKFGDASAKAADKAAKEMEQAAKEMERAQKEAFDNSVDFFSDIITGVIDGDLKEVLERMLIQAAIKFGAEMLAQLTASFALQNVIPSGAGGLGGLGGIFGNLFSGGAPGVPVPIGGTPVAGAGLGSLGGFAGAGGLALGAFALHSAFQVATNGPDAAPFGFQRDALEATGLFGGLSSEQAHLGGIVDQFIEAGVLGPKGTFSFFGGGEGRLQASQGGTVLKGNENLEPLGDLFSLVTQGNIDEQFSGLFTNALEGAGSFNEALLTVSGLLEKAGINAEQAGQSITQAYLDGTISLEEFNEALNLTTQLGQDHLGSLGESAELLASAIDGKPRDALRALEIQFGTMKEHGIDEASEVVDYFTNTFGPEAGQSIQDMISAGIDVFGDFSSLTIPQIQLVLNEIRQMQGAFEDVGEAGQNAGNRARKGIDLIEQKIRDTRRQAQGLRSDLNNIEASGGGSDQPGVQP